MGFLHHPNGGWPWDFWTINSFNHIQPLFSKHPNKNGELIFCPKPKGGLSDYDYSVRYCPDQELKGPGRGSKMMKNWIIEGAFFKYLSVCSISVSIFEANMCVGGSHSSQHEDDMLCNFHHLTWGFLDSKLGEAIQCEGGLEQQDMPCRGGLSDEYPMNIRRFFRQTGVFWWVFFWGNKRNTHQEWQMMAVSMKFP